MNRPMHPALPRPALRRDLRHDLWRGSEPRARLRSVSHARTQTLTLLALTCVGFALRMALLDAFPLREDEAIYGFWARTAISDPFFLHIWPDKPPLFIWLLSGAFTLFGPSAASARLVSIFASTLTIPLVAWGARRLWQSPTAALLAAMLMTFNPFAVSFAPTAYTDSVLVLLGTGAVVAALNRRGFAAGLLLGAACMTKQQGLFYAPLVIALLMGAPMRAMLRHGWSRVASNRDHRDLCHPVGVSLPTIPERPLRGDNPNGSGWAKAGWTLLGAALIILPVLWWDSQRWAVAPSPWALALQTYAPLAWLPPSQWLARGEVWSQWLWYLGGSWTVWLMLGAALTVALGIAGRRRSASLHLAFLLGWGILFVALHLISNVQAWDRYLLPLAPWLALVASGPLAMALSRRLPDWVRGLLFILLMIGMAETVVPGVDAAKGLMPIGGDHGDYAGLTAAIAWVEDNDGPAILYHQVLGWHFRFYLYDELYDELQPAGENPQRFDLRWFPSATYLADNAAKTPYPPKYLIVPEWATPRDLALHLAMRGLALEPRHQVGRFAVMEILVPPRPLCDWCQSSSLRSHDPFLPLAMPLHTPLLMSVPTTP